uniref:Uncharacterized protein n=1 Tax=Oryza brachyantha TaxID=4533 RepID=J3LJY9_ORYBR
MLRDPRFIAPHGPCAERAVRFSTPRSSAEALGWHRDSVPAACCRCSDSRGWARNRRGWPVLVARRYAPARGTVPRDSRPRGSVSCVFFFLFLSRFVVKSVMAGGETAELTRR